MNLVQANNLIPILVFLPMLAGVMTTFLRGRIGAQRAVGVASIVLTLILALAFVFGMPNGSTVEVSMLGDWPAPFGIAVVFDGISGMLVVIAQFVALGCYLSSFSLIDRRLELGWFHPLFHLIMMGVNYSFLTGDLFNLFVAFEIMLLASYALLCLGSTREQVTQAYKYVILNLIGSTIFVLSAGIVYGMLGTLNYADLARIVADSRAGGPPLPTGFEVVSVMLLLVFTLKAAVFPLWFWLPDTYHTIPTPIAGLFAALLSKVGVYSVLRLFPMIFAAPGLGAENPIPQILTGAALGTMVIAILGAIAMREIRRVLSLVLISHVGFLIFGIVLMTPISHAATLFYMAQEMLVIAALFLCCGMIERHSGTDDLQAQGGLNKRAPLLALTFFIAAMSLIGIPPLSGFHARVLLIQEGFAAARWVLTAGVLCTAVLTLVAMLKVWAHVFWHPERTAFPNVSSGGTYGSGPRLGWSFAGVWVLLAGSLVMGFGGEPFIVFAEEATAGLTEPREYVEGVLGAGTWPEGATTQDVATHSDPEGVEHN